MAAVTEQHHSCHFAFKGKYMRVPKGVYLFFCLLCLMACQQEELESTYTVDDSPALSIQQRSSFVASFDDGNTRTELDGLRIKWNAGDEIRIYGTSTEDYFYTGTFSTEEGGYAVLFEGDPISTTHYFHAFYPTSLIDGIAYTTADEEKQIEAHFRVPTVQTAVANSFSNNLNICYAKTSSLENYQLYFYNACTLIKFGLQGEGIDNVKRVRFYANSIDNYTTTLLSGNITLNVDNGTVNVITGKDYVELEGEFQEGVYYYMMCAPVALTNGFTLSLFNEQGLECTKKGVKAATLHASEILNLGTIPVGNDDFQNGAAWPYTTNDSDHPVSWVVIPEGFTKEQMDDYHTKATEMLDFIFGFEPFQDYKHYFNIHILDAVSDESGADITNENTFVKTSFDAGWSSNNINNMKANSQRVFSFVESHNPDILNGKVSINDTGIIMLINDERYGGICWNWENGKSFAMIPMSKNSDGSLMKWAGSGGNTVTCEGTWLNIALHEAGGHMFGKLADEYVGGAQYYGTTIPGQNYAVPFGMNLTADLENKLFWSDFIPDEKGTKQMGKFLHVGTYEGGYGMYGKGIWRSEEVSCMDDNRTYFSAWQRYLIAKRIHDLAHEPFSYDDFFTDDSQYIRIQAGIPYAGTEGIITTFFEPDGIRYNNSLTPRRFSPTKSNDIMPPLPPPVLIEE